MDTELPSGWGESEPALLFLTTASGHTGCSIPIGIHLGRSAHLAVWSRFSNSVFSYRHTVVTFGYWKRLLRIRLSHLHRSSSQVIGTRLSTRLEIAYLKNTSEQRVIEYLINGVFNNCYLTVIILTISELTNVSLRDRTVLTLSMCLRYPASCSTNSPSPFRPSAQLPP